MTKPLSVVELFAGVGGFRIGLERELVGFSPEGGWEWAERPDTPWQVTFGNQWEPSTKKQHAFDGYAERFRGSGVHSNRDIAAVLNDAGVPQYDGETISTDVRTDEGDLPGQFNLLVGGFPCQDYSVAKPLSQAEGLGGKKGVLWWEIARILQQYRPDHVLLENVDRLLKSPSSQRGRDFAIILGCFAQLGYAVEWRVINAAEHGFPQRRRRVFIYATRDERWLSAHGIASPGQADWASSIRLADEAASTAITKTGVLAAALPCTRRGTMPRSIDLRLGSGDIDPHHITTEWPSLSKSEWGNAGVMTDGVAWTTEVDAVLDLTSMDQTPATLGEILLPIEAVLRERPEVVLLLSRLGDEDEPARGTWRYLKGSKREARTKTVRGETYTYEYAEGAVAFPEPLEKPSRTILTGEGGNGASRFKHVVRQVVPDALLDNPLLAENVRAAIIHEDDGPVVYRRLTPIELERLNMFPDDWTKTGMPDGRRAFCMGNALVIGIVAAIGDELASRLRLPLPVDQA